MSDIFFPPTTRTKVKYEVNDAVQISKGRFWSLHQCLEVPSLLSVFLPSWVSYIMQSYLVIARPGTFGSSLASLYFLTVSLLGNKTNIGEQLQTKGIARYSSNSISCRAEDDRYLQRHTPPHHWKGKFWQPMHYIEVTGKPNDCEEQVRGRPWMERERWW